MKGLPDWIEHLSAQARIGGARVFRDDQAYSLEGAAEVVRRLVELLERTKRTSGWAAASMGIAPGKLSEAIQGSAGNPEPVIRAVDKWLEAQALKAQAARQLRITGDGEAYLQALANEFGAGAYRTLDKLLQLAAKFAQGAEIDAAMLQAIQARRLGIGAAEVIETRMAARAARAVPA